VTLLAHNLLLGRLVAAAFQAVDDTRLAGKSDGGRVSTMS
jgi:hypothetical protein